MKKGATYQSRLSNIMLFASALWMDGNYIRAKTKVGFLRGYFISNCFRDMLFTEAVKEREHHRYKNKRQQ